MGRDKAFHLEDLVPIHSRENPIRKVHKQDAFPLSKHHAFLKDKAWERLRRETLKIHE